MREKSLLKILPLELIAAFLTVLILGMFAFFIVQTVNRINDGQRAIICILAIDPESRTPPVVTACLSENGL